MINVSKVINFPGRFLWRTYLIVIWKSEQVNDVEIRYVQISLCPINKKSKHNTREPKDSSVFILVIRCSILWNKRNSITNNNNTHYM